MKVRIGKYIDDEHVQYTNIELRCPDQFPDEEIIALTEIVDELFHLDKICTLKEFSANGDAFMYTENSEHMKDFRMEKPFWIIVEPSGFFWNANAMAEVIRNARA
jgi:hypothetical protein